MEKRKETLSALKLCRFCLAQDEPLKTLYNRAKTPKDTIPLALKILTCVSIEILPSDRRPSFICDRCRFFMELFFDFKQMVREADESILEYIQRGSELESTIWPQTLLKIYQSISAPKRDKAVVNTIVEGGATVEVTSQDGSDSEDDGDENVYDVKINEGSDDGSKSLSARIKVVSSKNNEPVEKPDKSSKKGNWSCDKCDMSYPLEKILELHKVQKHREKPVPCNKCDAKFFNKDELSTHSLRHSEETPFKCSVCNKKFKRMVLLKRHEKSDHPEMPQQPCPNCPATFLSKDELEIHQLGHSSVGRLHECSLCDKRFYESAQLQRHKDTVHKIRKYSCEYCSKRFQSVAKLARHVASHASGRPYPCKHCDKSFMKAHHYTRHLRMKHRDEAPALQTAFADPYRCEQCTDSFATQDELIYHSAIHATQNLTCPLCQERFDDVDAVTAHIKSHVNGTEFMCDYCELIFTSNEKLDKHMASAHEDEINSVQENETAEVLEDESSMEVDAAEFEEDDGINVTEEDGEMVVEIQKKKGFILPASASESEDKQEATNSEDSEVEVMSAEESPVEVAPPVVSEPVKEVSKPAPAKLAVKVAAKNDSRTMATIRKTEEVKRKVQPDEAKKTKLEAAVSSNDKSLRLLEKELQDLKRTNSRSEQPKTPKTVELLRNRRAQIHTSTPKLRAVEEKKAVVKSPAVEKKLDRKVVTKENKEPEIKDKAKDKETKTSGKEETKEKEAPKAVIKNGGTDKSGTEETVRRSTRPSKIKDYAKMIRDSAQVESEEGSDYEEEESKEEEKSLESRKMRRGSVKAAKSTPPATPAAGARKRGRPRKDAPTPTKLKKDTQEEAGTESNDTQEPADEVVESKKDEADAEKPKNVEPKTTQGGLLVSPTGQTLKKVPIKALPPGVKPLPLPVNARPLGPGELCQMQIGKKVVKVQKIVMTKAEVEAMTKKGLVEMKDGTMVLKQGIKLHTSTEGFKSTLVGGGDATKASPVKTDKAIPTRCDVED